MTTRDPPSSEITPQRTYLRRREFIRDAGLYVAGSAAIGGGILSVTGVGRGRVDPPVAMGPPSPTVPFEIAERGRYTVAEPHTSFDAITTYNNFYELGTAKDDPAKNAGTLRPRPWTVEISGAIAKPVTLDIDTLLRWFPLEERVYRMRCVEAWSMIIPWVGFPLAALLDKLAPTSQAKYVAFETLVDVEQLPGQARRTLDWPYVEALRLDEAMNPLTLLAVGLYGQPLLGQNGAPLRLVVPWKYGFKGIKSIVRIRLTEQQPKTTWSEFAPREYGFYANVDPAVSHPRWSQASERRIGEYGRRPTLPFNGYGEQVAHLYAGLDPRTLY